MGFGFPLASLNRPAQGDLQADASLLLDATGDQRGALTNDVRNPLPAGGFRLPLLN